MVEAARDCFDLLQNGYNIIFHVELGENSVTKYRHRSNGRILRVLRYRDRVEIWENSKILKEFRA